MSDPTPRPANVATAAIDAGVVGGNAPTNSAAATTAHANVNGIGAYRGRSSGSRWTSAINTNVAVMTDPTATTTKPNGLTATAPWVTACRDSLLVAESAGPATQTSPMGSATVAAMNRRSTCRGVPKEVAATSEPYVNELTDVNPVNPVAVEEERRA